MSSVVPTKQFFASRGAHFSDADAAVIGSYLDDLATSKGLEFDQLPVEDIFEAAIPEESPIHKYFEWNQHAGWRKHNLSLARHLVNHLRVEIVHVESDRQTRFALPAFVSIMVQPQQRAYIPVMSVLSSPDLRLRTRQDILIQLRTFKNKYEHFRAYEEFADLEPLFQLIDALTESA